MLSAAAGGESALPVPPHPRHLIDKRASWAWPVDGRHTILRPFLAPSTRYAAGHRGIDIAATGTVTAPSAGVVHFEGYVVNRPVLSLDHGGGVVSTYEPVTSALRAGDPVARGQVIGHLESGHCTETCLHFGVRVHNEYVSPMLYLGGIAYSVLLPTRPSVQ
jgi:murein DD-endopeptidase MepM/ murein hydrolase activator NlpD